VNGEGQGPLWADAPKEYIYRMTEEELKISTNLLVSKYHRNM